MLLNKKQLKLFGINDTTVVTVEPSDASSVTNSIKATTSESSSTVASSSTALLRHRAINSKQPLSSPSPVQSSSHYYRTEEVMTGFTPNIEPRNFDVVNSESYKEASWREISEAVDRRNNAGNAGTNR